MTSPAAFPHSLRRYLLFFFKQKTAYEMRISDWSSDVCSSDLPLRGPGVTLTDVYNAVDYVVPALEIIDARSHQIDPDTKRPRKVFDRSEERRVGNECVSTFRSRESPDH